MSRTDEIFRDMCRDILKNGTWEKGDVRPHWDDGTPAYTIKKFCVVNRYDLSQEFPLLTQLGHSDLWSERISSTFILLIFRSRGLLVMTSSPFLHSVLQAVTNLSIPASSTRQTRQAAISLISLRKHR